MRKLVTNLFGVTPRRTVDPMEAVAVGAAIQAGHTNPNPSPSPSSSPIPNPNPNPSPSPSPYPNPNPNQAGVLSGELTGVRVRQAWQAELGRLAVQWFGEGGEDEVGGDGGGGGGDAEEESEGEAGLTEEEEEEAAMAQYMQAQSKGAGTAGD